MTWITPDSAAQAQVPEVTLEEGCVFAGATSLRRVNSGWRSSRRFKCDEAAVARVVALKFPGGNPSLSTVVRWEEHGKVESRLAGPSVRSIELSSNQPGVLAYLPLGLRHIATGFDHLAFVFCLIFIAGSWRRTFWAVSGFTLGHCLSLTAGVFGYLQLPVAAVEIIIALSIMWIAAELLRHQRDTLTWRYPAGVATGFGIVHGLGFASVLLEIGLPPGQRVAALLLFNVGVEVGQIAFVVLVLAMLQWIRARPMPRASVPLRTTLVLVGGLSAFWFFERLIVAAA